MGNTIKAILFDFGGTLRRTTERTLGEKVKITKEILDQLDIYLDPILFYKLLSERAKEYEQWSVENESELSEEELWIQWMLKDCPADMVRSKAMEFNRIWRDSIGIRYMLPDAKNTLLTLFRRGYHLGLISNTTSSVEAPRALKELGIAACFDTMVLSCKVGKRKPSADIMLEATNRMGISPGDCAYVGDKHDRDVLAARRAGFAKTVLIHHPERPSDEEIPKELLPDKFIDNLGELLELFPPFRKRKLITPETPIYDISLSTMWGMKNFENLSDLFLMAPRLGFKGIELNHQVSPSMLVGIELNHHSIPSIHEPCPAKIPADTMKKLDILISSPDEERQREGINSIKKSIDLAKELGSKFIVVHSGQIQADWSAEKEFFHLANEGKTESEQFLEIREKFVTQRRNLAGPYLSAVKKSLRKLLNYAAKYGIKLGIENRYHYGDIPLIDEMEEILELADNDQIGFVYDIGHAQTQDRLGFCPHIEWRKRYSDRIIGAHIHDIVGVQDHLAPGLGEIDFKEIARVLPNVAFRTLEVQGFNTPDEIRESLKLLADTKCIKFLN